MMKSCTKRGPTFKPLTTKETLFFLLKKLQDKESQVSAMRIMIEERDEKITNHEKYIGALLDKMRELEFGDHGVKKVSRCTQTRLDASSRKRQSWYDAKKASNPIQNGFAHHGNEDINPYATLPRKRLPKRNKTEAQRKKMNEGVVFKSERSLISEEGSSTDLNTSSKLNSLTVRLLRSELSRVWKDLRDLESKLLDKVLMKERRIRNAANEIDTGRQKLISESAQLREIHQDSQNNDKIQEIGRLEDNMKLLHLEVKYKASEVFAVEENIRELQDICELLENFSKNVQETLEIDPEIFEGKAVFK